MKEYQVSGLRDVLSCYPPTGDCVIVDCANCRIKELEAERDKLREEADYSYEDTTRLAELRALAQAVVDSPSAVNLSALALALEADDE